MKGSAEDWKGPFYKDHLPAWPCPTCRRGALVTVPESLSETQTPGSKVAWELHGEPEMIVCEFSLVMRCSHRSCAQEVRVLGRTSQKEDENYQGGSWADRRWDERLHPVMIYPAPPIIDLPADCPQEVREQIERAFLVVWHDPSAAGNRLRVAVEALMDQLPIKRVPKQPSGPLPKGKRKRKSLHARLLEYRGEDRTTLSWTIGERLLAVKWLGNAGSHLQELTIDEVLVAFELLEAVLPQLCGARDKRLTRIAAEINKRSGPVRPRKRKGGK